MNEILFRGAWLKILRARIRNARGSYGKLEIEWPEGAEIFYLRAAAPEWAAKIWNPPSRLDKLGIKPGSFQAIGRLDHDFLTELKERGANPRKVNADVVFLAASLKSELKQLTRLGAPVLWIVYPKGLQAIAESDALAAGRSVGLVDVKFVPSRKPAKAAG